MRAGLPAGVFNVVTGEPRRRSAASSTTNPTVRKLSFTGSTEVGKLLMAQCAGTVKKVSLELGGNAPFIVFDDADLDAAVEGAIASKFRNSGQTCVCANRILVQDGVYDAFASKSRRAVGALKVGRGLEHGVEQGPLIDDDAVAKVERHIGDATRRRRHGRRRRQAARARRDVLRADGAHRRDAGDGWRARRRSARSRRCSASRRTQEAIELANDTRVRPRRLLLSPATSRRVWRVAEALEYGIVGINDGRSSRPRVAPFGGVKESGIGREGSHHGIEEYLEIKYLCLGGM